MTPQPPPTCMPPSDLSAEEPLPDAQLMAAVRKGDKLAFSRLYDRYADTVYAVCLRVLHRQAEAEAAVSDVFCEIWRKPGGFDPLRGSCRTYLFTLARSRSIDQLRASATRTEKTQGAMQEAAVEAQQLQKSQDPSELVVTHERRQAVREALDQLEREQREALLLAYFDGLTHREISKRLEKPLGTVKTHIRRGLQSLKVVLKSLKGQDELR